MTLNEDNASIGRTVKYADGPRGVIHGIGPGYVLVKFEEVPVMLLGVGLWPYLRLVRGPREISELAHWDRAVDATREASCRALSFGFPAGPAEVGAGS